MREQLIQYVNLLFAGATDSDEIKQEILQNTLDRYDDLIAQGKSPEAAYRLAITGIGDINEVLGAVPSSPAASASVTTESVQANNEEDPKRKKIRAIAVAMYILCAVPCILLSELGAEILGLCLTLGLVAYATYLMIITGKKDDREEAEASEARERTPQQELKDSIGKLTGVLGLAVYLIISFATGAWYITWIIFPIVGCIKGLIRAIIDLKEAGSHEN